MIPFPFGIACWGALLALFYGIPPELTTGFFFNLGLASFIASMMYWSQCEARKDPGYVGLDPAAEALASKLELSACKRCDATLKTSMVHHCKTCDKCVFMMDHHCIFTDQCVAYNTMKPFVLFIFYMTMLAFHALCYSIV